MPKHISTICASARELQLFLLYVQPGQRYLLSVGLHAGSLWADEVQLLLIAVV